MDSVREFLSLVLGLAFSVGMPALVAFLKNVTWPAWKKVGLSLLVSIALGALTVLVNGNIDLKNLTLSITAIFTAATVVYKAWFEQTRANGLLEEKKVLP